MHHHHRHNPIFRVSSGAGWVQTLPNWNSTMGAYVFPTLTIVMSGAGSASLTISNGTKSLVLDMSGETAGTFTVELATGIIKKGSTHKAYIRTSAVDTYFGVPAGGQPCGGSDQDQEAAELCLHP